MLSTKLPEADVNPHFLFFIRMSNLDPSKQGPATSKPDILVIEAGFDNLLINISRKLVVLVR